MTHKCDREEFETPLATRTQGRDALHRAFPAALLLTGSMHGAEQAVENAIDALGPDFAESALLQETVRSAMRQPKWQDETPSILPEELRALALLPPRARNSFVLRVLLGIERKACCEILELSEDDVDEALHQSLLGLPVVVEAIRQSLDHADVH